MGRTKGPPQKKDASASASAVDDDFSFVRSAATIACILATELPDDGGAQEPQPLGAEAIEGNKKGNPNPSRRDEAPTIAADRVALPSKNGRGTRGRLKKGVAGEWSNHKQAEDNNDVNVSNSNININHNENNNMRQVTVGWKQHQQPQATLLNKGEGKPAIEAHEHKSHVQACRIIITLHHNNFNLEGNHIISHGHGVMLPLPHTTSNKEQSHTCNSTTSKTELCLFSRTIKSASSHGIIPVSIHHQYSNNNNNRINDLLSQNVSSRKPHSDNGISISSMAPRNRESQTQSQSSSSNHKKKKSVRFLTSLTVTDPTSIQSLMAIMLWLGQDQDDSKDAGKATSTSDGDGDSDGILLSCPSHFAELQERFRPVAEAIAQGLMVLRAQTVIHSNSTTQHHDNDTRNDSSQSIQLRLCLTPAAFQKCSPQILTSGPPLASRQKLQNSFRQKSPYYAASIFRDALGSLTALLPSESSLFKCVPIINSSAASSASVSSNTHVSAPDTIISAKQIYSVVDNAHEFEEEEDGTPIQRGQDEPPASLLGPPSQSGFAVANNNSNTSSPSKDDNDKNDEEKKEDPQEPHGQEYDSDKDAMLIDQDDAPRLQHEPCTDGIRSRFKVKGLACTLRPYQAAAVRWMLSREVPRSDEMEDMGWQVAWVVVHSTEEQNGNNNNDTGTGTSIAVSPLPQWINRAKERNDNNDNDNQALFYYCPSTGWACKSEAEARNCTLGVPVLVTSAPDDSNSNPASSTSSIVVVPKKNRVRGGILADSMGLYVRCFVTGVYCQA
jgi:hypothetical protein